MQLDTPRASPPSRDAGYFAERYHRAFAEEGQLLVELLAAVPDHRLLLAPLTLCLRGLVDELAAHSARQEADDLLARADVDAFDADAAALAAAVDATRGVVTLTRPALAHRRALGARITHFLHQIELHLDEERAAFVARTSSR